MFTLIYSINMHTFIYQFERSVIDHYEGISLYKKSFCTEIRLRVYHFFYGSYNLDRDRWIEIRKKKARKKEIHTDTSWKDIEIYDKKS